jgi:hypothetical protein
MGIDVLTEDDGRQRMWQMAQTREWWIIPWVSEAASDLSVEIERRFYSGEANADFELFMCNPLGYASAVAFARKSRASPADIAALVGQPIASDEHDILIAGYPDERDRAALRAFAWAQDLERAHGWK